MSDRLSPLALPNPDAASYLTWLEQTSDTALTRVRQMVGELKTNPPADTLAALEAWNDIEIALGSISSPANLLSEVHPDATVRTAADETALAARKVGTEIGLDTDLYELFASLDPAGLDADAARLLERILRDFRRSGVASDAPTRDRIKAIRARLTVLSQTFGRAIREGTKSIHVRPEQLAGLPADWIADHPVGADGLIEVTTDYPDSIPFSTFAEDRDARRELALATSTIAYPANVEVLAEIMSLRAELAGLLGYDSWPDFDTEVKMIGSGPAIGEFINKVAEVAAAPAAAEMAVLLDRLRRDVPDAERLQGYDSGYYTELHRRESLDVDAQRVREYFDFTKVRAGLLDITGRLFGLTYTPVPDAASWHPDVAVYDVTRTDDGSQVGRIHLDLHPRAGKFKHAAQFGLVSGVRDRQLPEGALLCNFPTGLMEHGQVKTLFHEFGHLIHHLVGGQQRWVEFSGVATEWDFVEAPSQMLEEWAWDADVLASFATNAAGEPIPADLVARMRAASDFGKGFRERSQMFFAALSYWMHLDQPDDLIAFTRDLQARYSMFPYLPGTCFPTSFGHLDGYGSAYYTYAWSRVIAFDLFSQFNKDDLLDPVVAARYRDEILAPGGTRDAADLVTDFLGRPSSFDAFAKWLAS